MLLSVEAAQEHILATITPMPAETVDLIVAAGRVLAEAIMSPGDVPPFANSSMDGYAVRSADLAGADSAAPIHLPVAGEVPAGGVYPGTVIPGTVVRIFTGAPLPAGTDAVLQQELTAPGDTPEMIRLLAPAPPGMNVRAAGSDVPAGTTILEPGIALGAAEIAVLAAVGRGAVRVARRPRVAIVATGNELVEPGGQLAPGQIFNSNAPMLAAAVRAAGGEPLLLPIARDSADEIRDRFEQAARSADLILSSGGVSVGDYDLVRQVLETLGQIAFWRVNLRPGKPFAFGQIGTTPLLGLPGNPASSAVTFEIFARPLLRSMLGCRAIQRPTIAVRLGIEQPRGDRRHYLRARLEYQDGTVTAWPTGDQGSHRIASLIGADALAIIAEGQGVFPAGALVPALLLA